MAATRSYQLLVIGGGAGGITMASKFASILGKGKVAIVEPENDHFYQPLWTLVGAGIKPLSDSQKRMASVIPPDATWIHERAVSFEPEGNTVSTDQGTVIKYDFLIIAMGFKLHFGRIKGLEEALLTPGVCSNYSYRTVGKTLEALKGFKGGNAIFTQPETAVKCGGAPQKAVYLADAYLRRAGVRDKANMFFNTGLGSLFAVPVYAKSLEGVMQRKGITTNLLHNLIEVKPLSREAIFAVKESGKEKEVVFKYDMLHVTPPMSPPPELKSSCLVNQDGFLDVDTQTLRHSKYENIFGIGDCTNLPTSKTAAAVASQSGVLRRNLESALKSKPPTAKYDGYTSCPLVTSFDKCILAEFDYKLKPLETLPIDQSQERRSSYMLKAHLLAPIYWNLMLKGHWEGPGTVRKILHFGREAKP